MPPSPNPLDGTLFYRELGAGVRLRRLLERLTGDCDRLYSEAGHALRVSGFYAFYAIAEKAPLTISDISQLAGFSQSAVSQTVAKLTDEGLLNVLSGADCHQDGRQKYLTLSPSGKRLAKKLRPFWQKFDQVFKILLQESGHKLIDALDSLEEALNKKSLYDRFQAYSVSSDLPVIPAKAIDLQIIPYDQRYKQAFYDLNIAWLEQYFVVEPFDEKILSDPDALILNKGGEVFFAVFQGKAVGCVALKHDGDGLFEFTKFAVDPTYQGLGIGQKLLSKALERFKARAGKKLYLETNTRLKTARALYDRNGWIEVTPTAKSPYKRANCRMVWQDNEQGNTGGKSDDHPPQS